MVRKVKLPKEQMAFGLDEIEDSDLDFAVDAYSDDGGRRHQERSAARIHRRRQVPEAVPTCQ
jgi:hypothetical protein